MSNESIHVITDAARSICHWPTMVRGRPNGSNGRPDMPSPQARRSPQQSGRRCRNSVSSPMGFHQVTLLGDTEGREIGVQFQNTDRLHYARPQSFPLGVWPLDAPCPSRRTLRCRRSSEPRNRTTAGTRSSGSSMGQNRTVHYSRYLESSPRSRTWRTLPGTSDPGRPLMPSTWNRRRGAEWWWHL